MINKKCLVKNVYVFAYETSAKPTFVIISLALMLTYSYLCA